jgi:hypothetical protein
MATITTNNEPDDALDADQITGLTAKAAFDLLQEHYEEHEWLIELDAVGHSGTHYAVMTSPTDEKYEIRITD